MEKKLGNEEQDETYNFNSERVLGMEESDHKLLEETYEENYLRTRSPIRRNQERQEKKNKNNNTGSRE